MTIAQAIARLQEIQATYGADVDVFFDCPHCGRTTAPTYAAVVKEKTRAVLLKEN